MNRNRNIIKEEKQDLKVKVDTVVRTICLIIALVNQFLIIIGKGRIPFTEDEIYQAVSYIVLAVIAIWTWWKNNSFTKPAIKADEYMEKLRKEQ